jgi:signal transduction histidine kinase
VVFVRRLSWPLAAAAALLVLLATLATLQYRWLGEVSQAEGERMRANLKTRAADLAQEFDREITRTYVAFQIAAPDFDADPPAALAAAYTRWQSAAPSRSLLQGVYVLEGASFDTASLKRFDPEHGALEPVDWPADLAASMKQRGRLLPRIAGSLPVPIVDAVDARSLALVVPIPRVTIVSKTDVRFVATDASGASRILIVQFDPAAVRDQLLQPLVAKYFGAGAASDYAVTVARRDDPSATVFNTGENPVATASADVSAPLFDIRPEQVGRLTIGSAPPADGAVRTEHMAITIVRRGDGGGGDGARVLVGGGPQAAWTLTARHRSGSLDAVVARSRRRNLAISLGVLGLLAASVVLVMIAAQRQRRLLQQQMEFVASVTHELRTPLAVICSAGENLADGVVAEAAQVKTYGSLIETEGRRLGDMVERVLAFAGINAGARPQATADVDVARVIADAVSGVHADALDRHVSVDVRSPSPIPTVVGDADALRSAIQNIVGNAVKYSPTGGAVEVSAETVASGVVRIRVADRGLGIDAGDLPHIFKPFYRGRRALEAQVRGSGVGLSVVDHVIRAHGGDVTVESRPGDGTTVTVILPAGVAADRADGRRRVVRVRGERTGTAS